MDSTKRIALTIQNASYATVIVTSTILLYHLLTMNKPLGFLPKDWVFMAIYWFPTVTIFLIYIFMILVRTIWSSSPLLGTFSTLMMCLPSICGNGISTRFMMPFFDFICDLICCALISLFHPVLTLPMVYIHNDTLQAISFWVQMITVAVNVFVEIFLMDEYSYYSLIVVLVGTFHLIYGLATLIIIGDLLISFKYFMWIILEIVLLIAMLTISFKVRYQNGMHQVMAVLFLINYLIANTPFTKLLIYGYYRYLTEDDVVCKFLIDGNNGDDAAITMQDRYYCLLHSTTERKQQEEIEGATVHIEGFEAESTEITETTALLAAPSPTTSAVDGETVNNVHAPNSPHCFRIQHEYHRSDSKMKQRMINGLNPKRKQQMVTTLGLVIYALFSLIALIYPLVWFGYVWLYLVIISESDTIWVSNEAQIVFYWIIGAVYSLMFVICAAIIGLSARDGLWTRISAAIFVWNFEALNAADVSAAKQIVLTMPTVATVLESQRIDSNVAMLILSHLF